MKFLLLFIGVPAIELALLIEVGAHIGTLNTFLLIIVTGILGANLARSQGLGVVRKVQAELAKQRFPRAACLIDVLRLTLAVNTADQILAAFEALEDHARTNANFFRLMRYKNKYHEDEHVSFRNLMVNVLFQHKGFWIAGELQLTTVDAVKMKTRCFGGCLT